MSTTTRPDHAAEYTRADNAVRSLTRALDAQRDAIEALGALCDADAIELRSDMELSVHRLAGLIRRETARRDAAELAQDDESEDRDAPLHTFTIEGQRKTLARNAAQLATETDPAKRAEIEEDSAIIEEGIAAELARLAQRAAARAAKE